MRNQGYLDGCVDPEVFPALDSDYILRFCQYQTWHIDLILADDIGVKFIGSVGTVEMDFQPATYLKLQNRLIHNGLVDSQPAGLNILDADQEMNLAPILMDDAFQPFPNFKVFGFHGMSPSGLDPGDDGFA